MPLTGKGKKGASENIRKMMREHSGEKAWPRERIIAAGMNAAGVAKKPRKPKKK